MAQAISVCPSAIASSTASAIACWQSRGTKPGTSRANGPSGPSSSRALKSRRMVWCAGARRASARLAAIPPVPLAGEADARSAAGEGGKR